MKQRTSIRYSQEFRTARLHLRALKPDDANEILFFRSDERILEFLDMPKAKSLNDALLFINKITEGVRKGESFYWGFSLNGMKPLIGTICLWNFSVEKNSAEVGYVLHPDFQGKGIMHEALQKVLNFGFKNLLLNSIDADLSPKNVKSVRLLERNGFVRIASLQTDHSIDEIPKTVQYSLFNPSAE